jgi:hypothetical protein
MAVLVHGQISRVRIFTKKRLANSNQRLEFAALCYSFPFMRITVLILVLGICCLAGCGTPGVPLPPSLNIPKPVHDLQATRKGDVITLTWTTPTETTDGTLTRRTGKIFVRRAFVATESSTPVTVTTPVRELPLKPALKDAEPTADVFSDSFANLVPPGSANFAVYKLEAENSSGKSAGDSNQAFVPLVPLPATPKNFRAEVIPEGVKILWDQSLPPKRETGLKSQYGYKIMRQLEGSHQPVVVAQPYASNQAMALIDKGIEWEKKYQYWITPITAWQQDEKYKGVVEGEDSPVVSVTTKDIFPPAVPAGLQAVFSGVSQQSFIDLTWSPNTEPDLAGYNIYRHVENQQPVKINTELVKTPSFRDSAVQAGNKYFYSVSAVDLRENESARSQETSEAVPRP